MQSKNIQFQDTNLQIQNGLIIANQRNFNDILTNDETKIYNSFNSNQCCCTGLIGNLIYIIVMSSINIIFVIVALTTLIKKNPHYISLETTVCPISSNPLSKLEVLKMEF